MTILQRLEAGGWNSFFLGWPTVSLSQMETEKDVVLTLSSPGDSFMSRFYVNQSSSVISSVRCVCNGDYILVFWLRIRVTLRSYIDFTKTYLVSGMQKMAL